MDERAEAVGDRVADHAVNLGLSIDSLDVVIALHEQAGERFEGIVASPVEPAFQIRGFRYFLGGHPMPNAESIRAAEAMLKSLNGLNENSLAIYCLGILLSFMGFVILSQFSSTIAMQVAVSMAGIALMIAAANIMTWTSKQDRPGPKLF